MGYIKKRRARFAPLFMLAGVVAVCLAVTGCSSTQPASEDEGTSKINVVASFYPMADFAEKIGGDKVDVTNLVPAGIEPHDWEPSTTDVRDISDAALLVYNGAGMESWVEDVMAGLDGGPAVVEASAGVTLIEGSAHEDDEASADQEGEEEATDPHVWLDPENAKIEMRNIADALASVDPDNASYYEENYDKYAEQIDELDQEFRDGLASSTRHTIVVSHEAFGYLCNAYGLEQLGIEGLSADSEPDAARMAEIIDFVNENDVTTIFFEDLVSPKVAESIARETGADVEELNPLEGLTDDEIAAGEDYFSIMRKNLTSLIAALA